MLLDSSCWATFRCSNPAHSKVPTFPLRKRDKNPPENSENRRKLEYPKWRGEHRPWNSLKRPFFLLYLSSCSWIPSLQLFVLGKCFPSSLNIWMTGFDSGRMCLKNEREGETFIGDCDKTMQSMLGSLFVGGTAEEESKNHRSDVRVLLLLRVPEPGACGRSPNVSIHRPVPFTVGEIPLGWRQKWNRRSTGC